MSEHEQETGNGEELIDEEGRNPTQRQIDGDERGPANTEEETNDEPAQGEGPLSEKWKAPRTAPSSSQHRWLHAAAELLPI